MSTVFMCLFISFSFFNCLNCLKSINQLINQLKYVLFFSLKLFYSKALCVNCGRKAFINTFSFDLIHFMSDI